MYGQTDIMENKNPRGVQDTQKTVTAERLQGRGIQVKTRRKPKPAEW